MLLNRKGGPNGKQFEIRCIVAVFVISLLGPTLAAQAVSSLKTTWDGVYTATQALRGGSIYQTHCASCHGPQLNGIDAAPALNGGAFYANWNGIPLNVMANRIKISMPQNRPGTLSRQQVADVMAYLFSSNGFPSGEKELPKRPAYMKDITFQPTP